MEEGPIEGPTVVDALTVEGPIGVTGDCYVR